MKSFQPEELLTSSDLNTYCVNSIAARKTSNFSQASTVTIVDDNHLFATVAANSVYQFQSLLKYTSASATPGITYAWQGPAGATLSYRTIGLVVGATSQSNIATVPSSLGSTVSLGTLAGATEYIDMHGLLVVGGTGGTFKLQWAQQTSSATQTSLLQDSFFVLRRID
ncbi:hypothetical protein [Terrabacter terrigena]|uniref:Uncharacterized protein n=1 Tax=Terrabacter terrigena TaxID=574718 RepID=A0ABW3MXJ6_9MICO